MEIHAQIREVVCGQRESSEASDLSLRCGACLEGSRRRSEGAIFDTAGGGGAGGLVGGGDGV